jgi:hypothetical protein
MRRFFSLALMPAMLLTMACGSAGSSRPATVAKPDMNVELAHDLFFGSGATAPATIDVTVLNRATVPILLRRVELSSPGMVQYGIYPITRQFHETIQPGETKTVAVFATAQTSVRRPTEPLTLRAIVDFEASGKVWREMLITR